MTRRCICKWCASGDAACLWPVLHRGQTAGATKLSDDAGDELLGFLLNLVQMIFAGEAFGVDLVNILGAGGPGREPSALGDHFQSAKRRARTRGGVQLFENRI